MKRLDVIKVKRIDDEVLTCELMTINDDLRDFYEHIGCSCIDIVERRFNGVLFDVICDDEALLKNDIPLPTSYWSDGKGEEGLFGTLLLCHNDGNGNLTDARADDLLAVQQAYRRVMTNNGDFAYVLIHDIR